MKHKAFGWLVVTATLFILLGPTTGCNERWQAISAVSFGFGTLVGGLTAPTTIGTTCYRNGVLVDCSEAPE